MATATIFGASGLTGSALTELLLNDAAFKSIKVVVRKLLNAHHEKLQQVVIDFSQLRDYPDLFSSDHIFCCLGTTMEKEKGNKETYKIVDKEYPVEIARNSAMHNCKSLHIMSSMGANPNSKIFYSKLKGEMQEEVIAEWEGKISHSALCIYQPGLLEGDRKEKRFGEGFGKIVMRILNPILIGDLRKYKSIQAKDVALVMMHNALHLNSGLHIIKNDALLQSAKEIKS